MPQPTHPPSVVEPPKLLVQAGVDVSVALERASVGSRGAAYIADLLVLILVWLIIIMAVVLAVPIAEMGTSVFVGAAVGWFVSQWLYFGIQEAAMGGQTLGKKLVGIRVVNAAGQSPGFGAALLRNVLRPIDNFPHSYGVATLLVGGTQKGRRVGDLLAGTHVVHEVDDDVEVPRFTPPPGASEPERLLLEQWITRRDTLDEAARVRVATRLVGWLEARWPTFLPTDGAPEARLAAALSVSSN